MKNLIRTRFAPSPTGSIHIGNIRSALYPWLFSKKNNGNFILRIDDTDVERSDNNYIIEIIKSLKWLGINYDEGPFLQTQRIHRYYKMINFFKKMGYAYPCYMSIQELNELRINQKLKGIKPRYNKKWRPCSKKKLPKPPNNIKPVIRFKNPKNGKIMWNDLIKGKIEISNNELDDFIIERSDGTPTYNFCVVIDDIDMKITHVIRGDDHINNTPKQINIFKSLGIKPPIYAHLPTMLNKKGNKISKRLKNKKTNILNYKDNGFLPEAIINYLSNISGYNKDIEIFPIKKFIKYFNLNNLKKSPAKYDHDKLTWINHQYIKNIKNNKLVNLLYPFLLKLGINDKIISKGINIIPVIELMKYRSTTLKKLAKNLSIFYKKPKLNQEILKKYITKNTKIALTNLIELINICLWTKNGISYIIKIILNSYKLNISKFLTLIRLIFFGKISTPPISDVFILYERNIIIKKINTFLINYIN